ncbi:tyrosine-type recombinase/integrase [Desulfitobacterium hafniense]|uniref:tyrosine-type recombinase/integrase n=1 Tax=Desulfitobacterium hafniense TaxID=49338 RepID=UPI00036A3307|nr:tyrosine-type recombinase/integrase [Desulfitobacterium hafniense]
MSVTAISLAKTGPIRSLMGPFLVWEKAQGVSKNTQLRAQTSIELFFQWLNESKIETTDQLSHDAFENYVAYLYERPSRTRPEKGLEKSTIAKQIDFLKHFSRFLLAKKYVFADFAENLTRPKPKWTVIQAFSDVQVRLIFSELNRAPSKGRTRKAILIFLLLDTGLRISEALHIVPKDIDFLRRLILVIGKGDKQREVPFSERTAILLQRLIAENSIARNEYIWRSERTGRPMTTAAFRNTLLRIKKNLGAQGGIDAMRVSPHIFRHTFAKNWIKSGGDAFSLRLILGHSSIQMTQKYVDLWSVDLLERHDLCRPTAKLGIDDQMLFI